MTTRACSTTPALRVRMGALLVAIAVLAVLLWLLIPIVKRTLFPETWNTWIVKTVTRADGAVVRVRIRRYPDHDAVYPEVLVQPREGRLDERRQESPAQPIDSINHRESES